MKQTTDKKSSAPNPVFNSVVFKAAFKIGAIYAQRGINNFADWSSHMTEKIDKKIRGLAQFGKC